MNPSNDLPEGTEKKKFFDKVFFIGLAISSTVMVIVGTIIFLIEYFLTDIKLLGIFLDVFGITGLLGLLIFIMSWVATKGTFDALEYSLKLLFYTTFKPEYRKNGFPRTLYDYKMQKDEKGRSPIRSLLFVSVAFLIVGIVLAIIYR